jgi:hypothetical protein
MSYGHIYLAADFTNGMVYVGQETGGPFSRRCRHLRDKKKDHFHSALRKRPDAFGWMIICECGTQQELNDAEIFYGEMFNCLWPDGYCLKLGNAQGKHSDVLKEKNRQAQTGKKRTQQTIENNRLAQLEAQNRSDVKEKKRLSMFGKNKGKKRTPEQRVRMSEALREVNSRPGMRERKRLAQLGKKKNMTAEGSAACAAVSRRPEVAEKKRQAMKVYWERHRLLK